MRASTAASSASAVFEDRYKQKPLLYASDTPGISWAHVTATSDGERLTTSSGIPMTARSEEHSTSASTASSREPGGSSAKRWRTPKTRTTDGKAAFRCGQSTWLPNTLSLSSTLTSLCPSFTKDLRSCSAFRAEVLWPRCSMTTALRRPAALAGKLPMEHSRLRVIARCSWSGVVTTKTVTGNAGASPADWLSTLVGACSTPVALALLF
mmetsp:Transcript_130158/g.236503  ORF Transcript_130158/g.236503 Transcript_130158/m.236503 type:complete len:209 (+) Transcript_130158:404-1030(+)